MERQGKSIVLRRQRLPAVVHHSPEDISVCPSCGRTTRTVGRGTCADCWQPKVHGGEAAIEPREQRTQPLGIFQLINDLPDIVWVLAVVAALAGAVRIAASLF